MKKKMKRELQVKESFKANKLIIYIEDCSWLMMTMWNVMEKKGTRSNCELSYANEFNLNNSGKEKEWKKEEKKKKTDHNEHGWEKHSVKWRHAKNEMNWNDEHVAKEHQFNEFWSNHWFAV